MARFNFNGEKVSIIEGSQRVDLDPGGALDLLQWMYEHRNALYALAYPDATYRRAGEQRLEIRLYQENMDHLDKLKAAIPDLHERQPAVKILDARWDPVTERAIELLKELQLEYRIHPLLEEDNVF